MTATLAVRPAATTSRSTRNKLTGTGALIRLNLRRERIPLLAWILGIGAVAASTFSTIAALYPEPAERAALALSISTNPAFLAITGPISDTSVGAISAWRVGAVGTSLVGLMAIFTVIRRTRADEETGRTELLSSAVVGRAAPLVAAVTVAIGASLAIGVLIAAAGIGSGQDAAGSIAFGAAMAGCGLVFGGVAAIAAQLAESSRTALGIACGVLAAGYGLRAIGDVQPSLSWLTWLSPQGWANHVGAYGDNNFAVLVLFLVATVAALVVAGWLLDRRDLGLAMFPARLGPADNPRMSSAGALAARLQRGSLIGWTVGMAALGAVTGAVASTSSDLLTGNPQLEAVMAKIGGAGAITDMLLSTMGVLAGLIVGGYAISAALRMSAEENADRVGPVLATAVGRPRWMAGHLVFVVAGPVILLAMAGLVGGVINGGLVGNFGDGLTAALGAMLVQIPATLVLGGLAVALFGWLPRLTSLAWAALVLALLLGQLGQLLQLPQWLMDVSPFTHVPLVPVQDVRWTPLIVLTAVAAGLICLGIAGFRRRDVH
jgi:polyether ionophore transport system permease protein